MNPTTLILTDIVDSLNNQIVAFPQTVGGQSGWSVGYHTNYSAEMLEMGYEDKVFSLVFYPGINIWDAAELVKEWDGQDGYKKTPGFESNKDKSRAPIVGHMLRTH